MRRITRDAVAAEQGRSRLLVKPWADLVTSLQSFEANTLNPFEAFSTPDDVAGTTQAEDAFGISLSQAQRSLIRGAELNNVLQHAQGAHALNKIFDCNSWEGRVATRYIDVMQMMLKELEETSPTDVQPKLSSLKHHAEFLRLHHHFVDELLPQVVDKFAPISEIIPPEKTFVDERAAPYAKAGVVPFGLLPPVVPEVLPNEKITWQQYAGAMRNPNPIVFEAGEDSMDKYITERTQELVKEAQEDDYLRFVRLRKGHLEAQYAAQYED